MTRPKSLRPGNKVERGIETPQSVKAGASGCLGNLGPPTDLGSPDRGNLEAQYILFSFFRHPWLTASLGDSMGQGRLGKRCQLEPNNCYLLPHIYTGQMHLMRDNICRWAGDTDL